MDKKLSALIVDDEEKAVALLASLLHDTMQFSAIRSARSPIQAVSELDGWEPDLIFLDIKMPGKDGVSFLKDLRLARTESEIVFVKHGLLHKTNGNGLLNVNIDSSENLLTVVIEDNGVGRERAAAINPRKGSGLKITSEFYEILNQLRRRPLSFEIIDLHAEDGTPSGTRVVVNIPIEHTDEPAFSPRESSIPA
jgi:ActR/RegA family two-component response regulator